MKQLIFIILAALMLIGCKAKQTAIKENTTASLIDTTHTVADTMSAVSNYIDTTTSNQHVEQSATIEFVDGGGTVNIDQIGSVTIEGVKAIKGSIKADAAIKNGVTERDSVSAIHTDLAYGIVKHESKQRETEEKVSKTVQWYERPLIWIGSLCCIAVLLYILFIYLKRKF